LSSRDSNDSLRPAVKALFRHLHDPRALRRNPLVGHFFEISGPAAGDRRTEQRFLESVQEVVRQGAAFCRDADSAAGKDERARCQYAIVAESLEGRSIAAIAARLGISVQYCYRQRAEVGVRIAHYIRQRYDPAALDALPNADEFQLLMDRAHFRAAGDDAQAAMRACEDVVRRAPSPERRIEALRALTNVALHFGDVARAKASYAAAVSLATANRDGERPERHVAEACIDLAGSKLAFFSRGDASEALRLARRATARLAFVEAGGLPHVRELYVESLYQLGAGLCNLGRLEEGYDRFVEAEAGVAELRAASARLRARIAIGAWQLRNHFLMNSRCWRPAWQRERALRAAFEQAYAAGLHAEAIDALVALAEHYANARNGEGALRAGHLAVTLAGQQGSERIRYATLIRVAMALISTPHWEYGAALAPSPDEALACDAHHQALALQFPLELALRRHDFQAAWRLAQDQTGELRFLTVGRQIIAAAAANELERRGDARALIEAAIAEAERLGAAPTLHFAYKTAARVTGAVRFKRRARELRRLLMA
jgi:hypothetical protein